MAAKKKANGSPGTAVMNVDQELAKEAENIASRIQAPAGDFIKVTQDKHFKLPDGTKNPGPLTCVILDWASVNMYYDRPFDNDDMGPPACFAISPEPNNMIPSPNSPDKQAESCKGCPNNEFGSKGKGKACRNMRILALTLHEPVKDGEPPVIYKLKVSPTAIKAFDNYVATVRSQFNTTPLGVATDIFFDPANTYATLRFGNPQQNKFRAQHMKLREAAKEALAREPDVSNYTPATPKKKGSK